MKSKFQRLQRNGSMSPVWIQTMCSNERFVRVNLKDLFHDILSHFCDGQNYLQIEGKLKIIVHQGRKYQTGYKELKKNKDG